MHDKAPPQQPLAAATGEDAIASAVHTIADDQQGAVEGDVVRPVQQGRVQADDHHIDAQQLQQALASLLAEDSVPDKGGIGEKYQLGDLHPEQPDGEVGAGREGNERSVSG